MLEKNARTHQVLEENLRMFLECPFHEMTRGVFKLGAHLGDRFESVADRTATLKKRLTDQLERSCTVKEKLMKIETNISHAGKDSGIFHRDNYFGASNTPCDEVRNLRTAGGLMLLKDFQRRSTSGSTLAKQEAVER